MAVCPKMSSVKSFQSHRVRKVVYPVLKAQSLLLLLLLLLI
jgi:hypothetical protein